MASPYTLDTIGVWGAEAMKWEVFRGHWSDNGVRNFASIKETVDGAMKLLMRNGAEYEHANAVIMLLLVLRHLTCAKDKYRTLFAVGVYDTVFPTYVIPTPATSANWRAMSHLIIILLRVGMITSECAPSATNKTKLQRFTSLVIGITRSDFLQKEDDTYKRGTLKLAWRRLMVYVAQRITTLGSGNTDIHTIMQLNDFRACPFSFEPLFTTVITKTDRSDALSSEFDNMSKSKEWTNTMRLIGSWRVMQNKGDPYSLSQKDVTDTNEIRQLVYSRMVEDVQLLCWFVGNTEKSLSMGIAFLQSRTLDIPVNSVNSLAVNVMWHIWGHRASNVTIAYPIRVIQRGLRDATTTAPTSATSVVLELTNATFADDSSVASVKT